MYTLQNTLNIVPGGTNVEDGFTKLTGEDQLLYDAINEVDAAKETPTGAQDKADAVQANLTSHINDATDTHMASAVGNTPAGGISAVTVQGAIDELDSEKASIAQLQDYSFTAKVADVITSVDPRSFGAVGDGVADDTTAIQNCLIYAFANNLNITSQPLNYAIGSTVIIPQNPSFARLIDINFNGAKFTMLADVTLFTSGYDNAGVLTSNFGTVLGFSNSFEVTLRNFSIYSSVGLLLSTTLKIQDYHQGCLLQNIASNYTQTILESCNNFYASFDGIRTILSGTGTQSRFIFSSQHNLCKFSNLLATNSTIGYHFKGSLTACQLTNMSFEGINIGAQFDNYVYDCSLENSYIENISDVAIKFIGNVYGFTIKNNYINFLNNPNMYLVEYVPLPNNNVIVGVDNYFGAMPSDANIFKTKDNTPGYSLLTIQRPPQFASNIDMLYVDNANFSNQTDYIQRMSMTRGKANVVNKYVVGNYAGMFTTGFDVLTGGSWLNNSNNILAIRTKITNSFTQNIYINIKISATTITFIKGNFIGTVFYEYTATGVLVTTALSITIVNGFLQINAPAVTGTITAVYGEIRLI